MHGEGLFYGHFISKEGDGRMTQLRPPYEALATLLKETKDWLSERNDTGETIYAAHVLGFPISELWSSFSGHQTAQRCPTSSSWKLVQEAGKPSLLVTERRATWRHHGEKSERCKVDVSLPLGDVAHYAPRDPADMKSKVIEALRSVTDGGLLQINVVDPDKTFRKTYYLRYGFLAEYWNRRWLTVEEARGPINLGGRWCIGCKTVHRLEKLVRWSDIVLHEGVIKETEWSEILAKVRCPLELNESKEAKKKTVKAVEKKR